MCAKVEIGFWIFAKPLDRCEFSPRMDYIRAVVASGNGEALEKQVIGALVRPGMKRYGNTSKAGILHNANNAWYGIKFYGTFAASRDNPNYNNIYIDVDDQE